MAESDYVLMLRYSFYYMSENQKEILILIIAVTCLLAILTAFMALTVIIYNKRKKKIQLEKEIMKKNFDQELLRTQLEIQEQTLKTISEEIHDNIGQALSLAKLKLNTLHYDEPELLKEKITDTKELVSKAIRDLRDLSRSLNTDNISAMGIGKALEQELELLHRSGFQTSIAIHGNVRKQDPQRELILFRIVQEALNNIIKHAEASRILVSLQYTETALQLEVTDNGIGTDPALLEPGTTGGKSLGLRNMHNRARMIGGTCTLSSRPGTGTTVTLTMPY